MNRSDILQRSEANKLKLGKLTSEQIGEIDAYLHLVGDYGEVHLIVQNGKLRYINTVTSHKASIIEERKKVLAR
jgi:hypothetical protein